MTRPPAAPSLLQALDASASFQNRIRSVKASLDVDFAWYPYESLSNLVHLSSLLRKMDGDLLELIPNQFMMDLGCGDGELSLFFETLGFSVEAVDCARSSHNGLRGARSLIGAMGSGVRVHELDLDSAAALPAADAGLALCLGLLYHLKNPYGFLERLARCCHYCILSTRVFAGLPAPLGSLPVAYLLHDSELNQDDSNYWLFSQPGLARLLDRTGWSVVASLNLAGHSGNSQASPFGEDQRAFMVLASKAELRGIRMLNGWYGREESGWRWTAPEFSFVIPAAASGARTLCLDAYIPPGLHDSTTLAAVIDGECAGSAPLDGTEFCTIRIPVPARLGSRTLLTVECSLSRAVRTGADKRELGLLLGAVYCAGG